MLIDNRKSMTPLLFQAVLFLKFNSTYWNECTVKEAMDKVKSEKVQNRLKEDTQHCYPVLVSFLVFRECHIHFFFFCLSVSDTKLN